MSCFNIDREGYMERIFSNKIADELLDIAHDNWKNIEILQLIFHELSYRQSKSSIKLRKIIEFRLNEFSCVKNDIEISLWPSTKSPAINNGYIGDFYWYKDGIFSYVGYRVGKTNGVDRQTRHSILECIYKLNLPNVKSKKYMQEWGKPCSENRLQKMVNVLSRFSVNAKNRNQIVMMLAISEWEDDLFYLYKEFYEGKFNFSWPST